MSRTRRNEAVSSGASGKREGASEKAKTASKRTDNEKKRQVVTVPVLAVKGNKR